MTESTCSLHIVMPCYYDSSSVRSIIIEILGNQALRDKYSKINFLIVDDSAGLDIQFTELAEFSEVSILSLPVNMGHQSALAIGLRYLSNTVQGCDIVVTMDSDGEDDPADLKKLLVVLEGSPESIALARRVSRKASLVFRLMYAGFVVICYSITGAVIKTGNFAAFRGRLLKAIIWHPHFDICYSSSLYRCKCPRTFVDCHRKTRRSGESRMSFGSLVLHGLRMLVPFIDIILLRICILGTAIFGMWLLAILQVLKFELALYSSILLIFIVLLVLVLALFVLVSGLTVRSVSLKVVENKYGSNRF